ncbi:hypothetical protein EVA_13243 [gut metagenome]|uniref:Uncharacterized protein n=1 Tax=gut metagenome TaxID=749906 RepID=J9CF83_9ZZZZ
MLESHLFEIQDDVGNIFLYAGYGGKLMLNTRNTDRVDSITLQRREKDAAQGVTNSNPEARLQRTEFEFAEMVVGLQHHYFVGLLKC